MEYTLVKKTKDNAFFEQRGSVYDFDAATMAAARSAVEAKIKELKGQEQLSHAVTVNVLNNNSWIADLTEEQIHAAHMYWENLKMERQAREEMDNALDALKEHEEFVKEVKKQTKVNILKYGKKRSAK